MRHMKRNRQPKRPNLGSIFDKHVESEFVYKDIVATMRTMVKEPTVHHVPVLTGVWAIEMFTIFISLTS
jgi:hypothetical protein